MGAEVEEHQVIEARLDELLVVLVLAPAQLLLQGEGTIILTTIDKHVLVLADELC